MLYYSSSIHLTTDRKTVYLTIQAKPNTFALSKLDDYNKEAPSVLHDGVVYPLATGLVTQGKVRTLGPDAYLIWCSCIPPVSL
jgi:hypothetical protein